MIYQDDRLHYGNVYSRVYICHYKELQDKLKEFNHILEESEIQIKGDLFYSINGFRSDGEIKIELFAPARAYVPSAEGKLHFHSYYSIDSMLSILVMGDFERNMELAYAALAYYAENNNMEMTSAIYNETRRENGMKYMIAKVSVRKIENSNKN